MDPTTLPQLFPIAFAGCPIGVHVCSFLPLPDVVYDIPFVCRTFRDAVIEYVSSPPSVAISKRPFVMEELDELFYHPHSRVLDEFLFRLLLKNSLFRENLESLFTDGVFPLTVPIYAILLGSVSVMEEFLQNPENDPSAHNGLLFRLACYRSRGDRRTQSWRDPTPSQKVARENAEKIIELLVRHDSITPFDYESDAIPTPGKLLEPFPRMCKEFRGGLFHVLKNNNSRMVKLLISDPSFDSAKHLNIRDLRRYLSFKILDVLRGQDDILTPAHYRALIPKAVSSHLGYFDIILKTGLVLRDDDVKLILSCLSNANHGGEAWTRLLAKSPEREAWIRRHIASRYLPMRMLSADDSFRKKLDPDFLIPVRRGDNRIEDEFFFDIHSLYDRGFRPFEKESLAPDDFLWYRLEGKPYSVTIVGPDPVLNKALWEVLAPGGVPKEVIESDTLDFIREVQLPYYVMDVDDGLRAGHVYKMFSTELLDSEEPQQAELELLQSDSFIFCFSIYDQQALRDLISKFVPFVQQHAGFSVVPFLVGLADDSNDERRPFLTHKDGERIAWKMNCCQYLEVIPTEYFHVGALRRKITKGIRIHKQLSSEN